MAQLLTLSRGAFSLTDLLMSLNLSRNAVAMERALSYLADAESSIDDCASCLARDVIVSEAQAADHNRSIVCARNALRALRGQLQTEHGEVCRHLRDAQMVFLQSKPLISLATGYTGSVSNEERDLDLSGFAYAPAESDGAPIGDEVDGVAAGRLLPSHASSSVVQQMDAQINEGNFEVDRRSDEAFSSLDSAVRDDECETVKGLSEDGHSYAGTVVRGVLRGQSE